jgi:hypothetical protein
VARLAPTYLPREPQAGSPATPLSSSSEDTVKEGAAGGGLASSATGPAATGAGGGAGGAAGIASLLPSGAGDADTVQAERTRVQSENESASGRANVMGVSFIRADSSCGVGIVDDPFATSESIAIEEHHPDPCIGLGTC